MHARRSASFSRVQKTSVCLSPWKFNLSKITNTMQLIPKFIRILKIMQYKCYLFIYYLLSYPQSWWTSNRIKCECSFYSVLDNLIYDLIYRKPICSQVTQIGLKIVKFRYSLSFYSIFQLFSNDVLRCMFRIDGRIPLIEKLIVVLTYIIVGNWAKFIAKNKC